MMDDIFIRILLIVVFTILAIVSIVGIKRRRDREDERPKAPEYYRRVSPVKPDHIADSATGETRPVTPEEKE